MSAGTEARVEGAAPEAHGPTPHAHPGPKQYVVVAIILAAVTLLEVGLYYLDLPSPLLITLLVFFSVIKFALVALWFMHLRFDSQILGRLFATGIALAASVYTIVLLITLLR